MRRLTLLIALVATACGMLLAPAGATAAKKKKAKNPTVTSVSPMRVKPRANLVIRGRNFSRSRRRNTVIFAVGRRSIFVKPSRASSRRLVVKLPMSARAAHARQGRRPDPHPLQHQGRGGSQVQPQDLPAALAGDRAADQRQDHGAGPLRRRPAAPAAEP